MIASNLRCASRIKTAPFLGPFREPPIWPHPIHIIEGDAYSLSVGESFVGASLPRKQQIRKGVNCNEKTSFNCFDGRRIGFRSRAAFRCSGFNRNRGRRGRIWLPGLSVWLLSVRVWLLPVWVLQTVSILWLFHGPVVIPVRASGLPSPPASSLLSLLS
jgi:hypothetical protein